MTMTPELWQKVSDALDHAVELDGEEQREFLRELRSQDGRIADEVETMLRAANAQSKTPEELEGLPDALKDHLADQHGGMVLSNAPESAPSTVDFDNVDSAVATPKVSSEAPEQKSLPDYAPRHAGRFRIAHEIASGGMGAVLRAHDPEIGRTLAVKIMLPKARTYPKYRALFHREARITGQLQHPGIPPIHELGQLEDGSPFFAMKLIEGETLADLLQKRNDPSHDAPRFLTIFEHICQTLGYAHSRGVIHRDLKPQNVMVGAFGEVQVMDWGLAKFLRDANSDSTTASLETATSPPVMATDADDDPLEIRKSLSLPGDVMGTPSFMAPEQARGENKELDERSDVFGLGAMLCMILTGRPPFEAANKYDLLQRASSGELDLAFERLDQCGADAELIDLCKRCLAPNREERPNDGGEVAQGVATFQKGVQEKLQQAEIDKAEAEVQTTEERKRRFVERHRNRLWLALAAVVFVLLTTASVGAVWYQGYLHKEAQRRVEAAAADAKEIDKLRLIEERLRIDVHSARKARAELHARLRSTGGTADMLNRPEAWRKRLNDVKSTLAQASI